MTDFDGNVGEGMYAEEPLPFGVDTWGSMTDFDGNVGEGMYAHDPLLPEYIYADPQYTYNEPQYTYAEPQYI
jgi:hypothetical protein